MPHYFGNTKKPKFTEQTSPQSWIHHQAQEKRARISILCEMERLPHFRSIVGTGRSVFLRWRPADTIQRTTPTLIELLLSYLTNGISRTTDSTGRWPRATWISNLQHGKWSLWIFGILQRYKKKTGVRSFTKTSQRIRSPPNHWKIQIELQNMSAFNIPSDNDTLLNTSPIEISFLLDQPEMPATLAAAFSDQPTTLNLLREYAFITIGINDHLNEISRHRSERKALFDTLMTSQLFQETMYPYLNNFRDLRDAETLPLYDTPSPNPTTTLSYTVETSELDQTSTASSPLTVEIHLPEFPTNHVLSNPKSSTASFHTANEPIESQSNPIDVDLIPTQLVNFDSGLHQSRSDPSSLLHCRMCTRNGHTCKTCLWDGAIVCSYCMEVGHGNKNCPAIRCDMAWYDLTRNFCMLCGQPGHTLVQCGSLQHPQ